jgi:hypothetical protein
MATVNGWVDLAGRSYIDVVIAAEATVTDVIALGGRVLTGLQFDSALAGTAITIHCGAADDDLAAYYYDGGTALSLTVAASRYFGFARDKVEPIMGYVRFTSGSAQGAETPTTVRVYASKR